MRHLGYLLLVVALCSCSGADSGEDSSITGDVTPRIINGIPRGENFPEVSQIFISQSNGGLAECTGSWIGAHKLLTAAHCVTDFDNTPVSNQSVVALYQEAGNLTTQESIRVDIHPEYFSQPYVPSSVFPDLISSGFDVAVVTFPKPFQGIPSIVTDQTVEVGDTMIIVGFGQTNGRSTETGNPQLGFTPIDALDDFRIFFRFTGEGDSNTCFGDSGGPAFVDFGEGHRLVGITSGGTDPFCSEGDLAVDIRVDSFLDWIAQVTEGDLAIVRTTVSKN